MKIQTTDLAEILTLNLSEDHAWNRI